ncbi:MAG: rod shape-determining protein RodA [Bryobacterales bacterium]|nr:rod shape-determining protein RodA [Bryobacterales bacterium]
MIARNVSFRDLDWLLMLAVLGICLLGILQIFSATSGTVLADSWWKQSLYLAVGLGLMLVVCGIDYHVLLEQVPVLYVVTAVALLGVLLFAPPINGSRSWIPLPGGFNLQVSEFSKVVILLVVSRYLAEVRSEELTLGDLMRLGALVGVPWVLVLLEPDLGTALTILPILAVGTFLGGLRWQHLVVILLVIALILPVSWFFLKDYQKARIMTFADPGADPLGSGYQVIQSLIAVGSGGMWGKGIAQGSQTQFRFLPETHTDFIMSTFAEEHGFAGVVVVLGLYFVLLMQIIQNAQMAPDRAGLFLCMGVAALVLFHLLVNVGMVIGRMPVTGIPLPLMSYGGSSLLTMFLLLGLVQSVRLRRLVR